MIFRRIIYTILSLIFISVMPSCAGDDTPDIGDGSNSAVSKRHGKISINMLIKTTDLPTSSRTNGDGELVDGFEHEIGTNGNTALFFDKDKHLCAVTLLTLDNGSVNEDDRITTTYTATLDPDEYDELPKYCLVVLNNISYFNTFATYGEEKTLNDILSELWECESAPLSIGRDDESGLFTLTNSVYYQNNVLTGAVELNENMIYDTKDPSAKARAEKLVIYVERLVAKFSFELNGKQPETSGELDYTRDDFQHLIVFDGFNTETGAPKYVSRKWGLSVTGWNINALEKNTYIFKNLPSSNYFSTWQWNDPTRFRSYWSQDYHYTGDYPLQYRKSVDVLGVNYYEDFENKNKNQLVNYSFNGLGLDKCEFNNAIYAPENTYDFATLKSKLDGRTDILAGTHVLVGGLLKIDTIGNNKLTVHDLYRDRDGFYYLSDKDCFKSCVYSFNATLKSQHRMRYTFYNWSGTNADKQGTVFYANSANPQGSDTSFKLYIDGVEVTNADIDKYAADFLALATIKSGDGRRLPWPKDKKIAIRRGTTNLRICDENGKDLREANQDDLMSILYEWLGPIDHFNNGRMYYVAPAVLRHGTTAASDVCGVVRNNWYQYNLLDVKGIGTPVDDPDQIIVPDPISNNDQLNLTIKIFDWHVIETNAPVL
ncbi:MAG: Mfa1 fimbrilin C-terminal domain-containing protein [Duncaniella sp.]|nr:Mfa1 fimbrilin C-terminal domain-containing protein [Duncaniella sp.]